jgi:hypothetical protein
MKFKNKSKRLRKLHPNPTKKQKKRIQEVDQGQELATPQMIIKLLKIRLQEMAKKVRNQRLMLKILN